MPPSSAPVTAGALKAIVLPVAVPVARMESARLWALSAKSTWCFHKDEIPSRFTEARNWGETHLGHGSVVPGFSGITRRCTISSPESMRERGSRSMGTSCLGLTTLQFSVKVVQWNSM